MVGSFLSILSLLVQPQTASAITDEQKATCVEKFPSGALVATAGGTEEEWTNNECDKICTTKQSNSTGITESTGCDPNKVPSVRVIEANSALVDGVKTGYGDLAAEQLCGSDEQCKAAMRGYVSVCIDEYMQNTPANAPEFPLMDTNWLVSCMSRDGKLDRSQISKLQAKFDENREKIANDAKKGEEEASKKACEEDGGTWVEESSECGTKVTCASSIQGIGWLICPAMNFMAEASDKIYLFLASKFLSVDVNLVAGVRDSWAKFRDVANIAFVIALLIVIYAQVTSVGISNYGIKKMLPKIVISAILVNVSYDIARIAVDLSNILGYGVAKFFDNFTFIETASDKSSLDALGNGLTIAGAVGVALVGAVGIAMAVSVPVLLSALLALALIALVLLAREALIVLLIAIAPLAFVAYLLPNTEQWYKKWVKLFSTLLLLFPIIGLVFGASKLAAITLLNAGAAANANGEADEITQILAIGVMTIPFFVVPGLLKGALNAAGSIGGKLSGFADRAGKGVGKNVKDNSQIGAYKKAYDRNKQIKRAQIQGGVYNGKMPLARMASGMNRRLNSSKLTGDLGTRTAQQAAQTVNNLEAENVKAANAQIEQANLTRAELRQVASGGSVRGVNGSDSAMRAAAVTEQFTRGDYEGAQQSWNSVVDGGDGRTSRETKRVVANAAARSGAKPGFIGAGALQSLREGDTVDNKGNSLHLERQAVVGSNRYSAESIAKTSNDELAYVADANGGAPAAMRDRAVEALDSDEIGKNIGNNRAWVEFYAGRGPRP